MAQYFETKASFDRTMSNGEVKTVTEAYLVAAESFADAEEGLIKELTPYMSGAYAVKAVKRTKICEVINPGVDKYWLAKVSYITIDEKTGAEKRSVSQMLVGGANFKEAYDMLTDQMRGTVTDYELVFLSEMQILDVFRL